jgi:alpha-tubulin suppressor-like RCC1 family protein
MKTTPSSRLVAWAAALAAAIVLTACGGGGGGGEAPAPVPVPAPVQDTTPPAGTTTLPPAVTTTVPPAGTTTVPPVASATSPALSISGPVRVVANKLLIYNATLTGGTAGAQASGIDWAWGDGTVNTLGSPAAKVWNKAGVSSVTLRATADGQALQTQQSVLVVSNPVSAGKNHACALKPDGAAVCWGDNSTGLLGIGAVTGSQASPSATVSGLTQAIGLATGDSHSCALHSDGTVSCWGDNTFGQQGRGASLSLNDDQLTAVKVPGISDAVALTAGFNHTCAMRATGQILCWGLNNDGQLGNGSIANTATPTAPIGLTNIVSVAAASNNTCALSAQGEAFCWGDNSKGQLGIGSANQDISDVPNLVQGLSDEPVIALTGGAHHCALMQSGTARCWGLNNNGQLGDGTSVDSTLPVVVKGLGGPATHLVAGSGHTCAIVLTKFDGDKVVCWGAGGFGQLGNGSTSTSVTPVTADNLPDAIALTAGSGFTCALRTGGAISCWGRGNVLGNGSSTNKFLPTPVLGGNIFFQ